MTYIINCSSCEIDAHLGKNFQLKPVGPAATLFQAVARQAFPVIEDTLRECLSTGGLS